MTRIIIDRTRLGRDLSLAALIASGNLSVSNAILSRPGNPNINSLSVTHAIIGAQVIIYGNGFGTPRGTSTVTFGGTAPGAYVSWGATQIIVTVPVLIPGAANVVITVGGASSNASTFSVDFDASQYYNVVTAGLAHGDGVTDDRQHILDAVTAYKAAGKFGLYFPTGTYLLSTALTVPNNTVLIGPANAGSGPGTGSPPYTLQTQANMPWLKGPVIFGSYSNFADLKIGENGTAVTHTASTTTTNFTRCHFRGGSETLSIGHERDAYYLTFTNCEIERACGASAGADTMSIYASYGGGRGYVIEDIVFDGCHLGVSNTTATGSPGMMVECWTAPYAASHLKNLTFRNCELQPSNWHGLDFACYLESGQCDGVLVEGCLFHGAGVPGAWLGTGSAPQQDWGYGIDLEYPKNVIIRNNHFHRCYNTAINASSLGQPASANWSITNNTFDYDTAEQSIVTMPRAIIHHIGANATITGNTFTCHTNIIADWAGCVELDGATTTGNIVTGNTFNLGTVYPAYAIRERGSSGNTVTPNTINRS